MLCNSTESGKSNKWKFCFSGTSTKYFGTSMPSNMFISITALIMLISTAHVMRYLMAWDSSRELIILVSDGCYCCQSWSGEAWGKFIQNAAALRRRSGSLLLLQLWWTQEWRRVLRLRLTPRMTWAVLTGSCEREITPGLLKLSVKNYSVWRAQRLWLCWHACNSCFKQKKVKIHRLNTSYVYRPKYWIKAC